MRVGWLEIVLIVIVVIAVTVIARIVGAGRREPDTTKAKGHPNNSLKRTGVFLIIAGIAGLIVAASAFRLVLQSYLWALIVIAAGMITLFIARRRR